MSQVFTVFLPNKTRYKLEVTKFTPLYQALEKVCTVKGYLPADNYAFRYNKIYPDLGSPVGMLNLSNLIELELVPASEAPSRKVASSAASSDEVSVGLQYGSQRHTEVCSCDTSLWDMICQFGEKHPDWIPSQSPQPDQQQQQQQQHPVLVHMRQEVPGEAALRGTSLRQLGLRPGGPATLLRLLHRPVPADRLDAARRLVEARQAATAAAAAAPLVDATMSSAEQSPPQPPAAAAFDASVGLPTIAAAASSSDANLFSPFRAIPRAEPQPPERSAASREPRTLAEALNLPNFEQQQPAPPAAAAAPVPSFGPDRPFRFPAETAGRDLYRNELADAAFRPAEFVACERQLCAYLAGAGAAAPAAATAAADDLEEPDESFFNLTEADLRRLLSDLKRKVEDETNGPLLTRQQREQRREDLYSVYEFAVVRLFFPDRRVVQAAFRPRETVFALYKFVRTELLLDAGTVGDFVLYTTPPKKEITDMAQFLIHADLVPMPIVYVGFREPPPEGQAILKPEILALVSSREDCDRKALSFMKSAVQPIYARQQQRPAIAGSSSAAASGQQRAASTVPKWFKK